MCEVSLFVTLDNIFHVLCGVQAKQGDSSGLRLGLGWVGLGWVDFDLGVPPYLAQLHSHFCQIPISTSRTEQTVEQQKSKSSQTRSHSSGTL